MDSLDNRLQAALQKKNQLEGLLNRIQGKRESAQKTLQELDDLCRAKGIDPNKLDEVIETLENRYEVEVGKLEEKVSLVEEQLKIYQGE